MIFSYQQLLFIFKISEQKIDIAVENSETKQQNNNKKHIFISKQAIPCLTLEIINQLLTIILTYVNNIYTQQISSIIKSSAWSKLFGIFVGSFLVQVESNKFTMINICVLIFAILSAVFMGKDYQDSTYGLCFHSESIIKPIYLYITNFTTQIASFLALYNTVTYRGLFNIFAILRISCQLLPSTILTYKCKTSFTQDDTTFIGSGYLRKSQVIIFSILAFINFLQLIVPRHFPGSLMTTFVTNNKYYQYYFIQFFIDIFQGYTCSLLINAVCLQDREKYYNFPPISAISIFVVVLVYAIIQRFAMNKITSKQEMVITMVFTIIQFIAVSIFTIYINHPILLCICLGLILIAASFHLYCFITLVSNTNGKKVGFCNIITNMHNIMYLFAGLMIKNQVVAKHNTKIVAIICWILSCLQLFLVKLFQQLQTKKFIVSKQMKKQSSKQ